MATLALTATITSTPLNAKTPPGADRLCPSLREEPSDRCCGRGLPKHRLDPVSAIGLYCARFDHQISRRRPFIGLPQPMPCPLPPASNLFQVHTKGISGSGTLQVVCRNWSAIGPNRFVRGQARGCHLYRMPKSRPLSRLRFYSTGLKFRSALIISSSRFSARSRTGKTDWVSSLRST